MLSVSIYTISGHDPTFILYFVVIFPVLVLPKIINFTLFQTNVSFQYSSETSGEEVSKGYRNRTFAWNGLTHIWMAIRRFTVSLNSFMAEVPII